MVTVLPDGTELPPCGFWEMTTPFWVGSLVLVQVSTGTRFDDWSVLTAWEVESPTTLGTVTFGGPVETTRLTVVPAGWLLPAGGLVLMTAPAAMVFDDSFVSEPHWKPDWPSTLQAVATVSPVTLGTALPAAVVEVFCWAVKRVTSAPGATMVLPGGCWEQTTLIWVQSVDGWVCTCRPSCCRSWVAAVTERFVSSGTFTCPPLPPVMRVTVDPFATEVPAAGFVRMTVVLGWLLDGSSCVVDLSPSRLKVASAWLTLWLVRLGRVTFPDDELRCHQPSELPRKSRTTASATSSSTRSAA